MFAAHLARSNVLKLSEVIQMKSTIQHVSDTAIWVATFRADESRRPDALFRDPLAALLTEERGLEIVGKMPLSPVISWSVVIRTCIIDSFIQEAITEGVDTILNLGAGLDTRPYRMSLPAGVRWIEVDFPALIHEKSEALSGQMPVCQLERVAVDLSNADARRALLKRINSESNKVLVITEGVVLYLSNEDVSALAQDLRAQSQFKYWVVEYFNPALMKRMLRGTVQRKLKNAPLKFNPSHWEEFYDQRGWKPKEIRYLTEEGERLKRPAPWSGFLNLFRLFLSKAKISKIKRMSGYALMESSEPGSNPR